MEKIEKVDELGKTKDVCTKLGGTLKRTCECRFLSSDCPWVKGRGEK